MDRLELRLAVASELELCYQPRVSALLEEITGRRRW